MAWANSNEYVISQVVARLTLADNTTVQADKLTYTKQASAMAQMVQARYTDLGVTEMDGGSAWRTKYLDQADAAMTSAINAANETARSAWTDMVGALSQCVLGAAFKVAHDATDTYLQGT